MTLFHAAVPRDGKAGTASLRYTGHYRPDATSVASLIICRSALAIEAQRGVASLANTLGIGKRCALRCAPMAVRSLRHLIGDATLVRHGVERIFHVPGESCLSVLDGLADGSPPVTADMSAATCRHESAAGVLALADAC